MQGALMQTLYAYQITPGSDDTLFFALTVEECRAAAIEQRRELRLDGTAMKLARWRSMSAFCALI